MAHPDRFTDRTEAGRALAQHVAQYLEDPIRPTGRTKARSLCSAVIVVKSAAGRWKPECSLMTTSSRGVVSPSPSAPDVTTEPSDHSCSGGVSMSARFVRSLTSRQNVNDIERHATQPLLKPDQDQVRCHAAIRVVERRRPRPAVVPAGVPRGGFGGRIAWRHGEEGC